MFDSLIASINRIGIMPGDEGMIANKKRFVVYEAILMSLGGILWGTFSCFILGRPSQSLIPYGYVVLSAINISLFARYRKFPVTQNFQTGISLLLPFLFQWFLGGFYASGGVMIWALLSLAASLSYSNSRASIFWLIVYVLLTAISALFDGYFASHFAPNYDIELSVDIMSANIAIVSSGVFILVIFYVNENTKYYSKAKDAQEMLIQSEKLAALGQLSAGIAHEINTPLGAIKAIAQESHVMGRNLINNILLLCANSSREELHGMLAFIDSHSIKKEFLTTKEERPIKQKLQEQLTQHNVEQASQIASKLCQINIYSIDPNLEKLIGPNFPLIVDTLHILFLEQKNNATTLTSVEKASRIVKALKMYLHTSEDNTPESYSLRESIDTVLTIYHNQIKHGIRVSLDIPENIQVVGFVEQIGQVWTNLIVNACQAMDFKGNLTITARQVGTSIHVTITDTGCGIPEEIGERVFDAFYSTKKIGEGSGLGLDIVRNIVLRHNGSVYYESRVGVGTSFHVILPSKFGEA
jgi:signal transduction histidine kinase